MNTLLSIFRWLIGLSVGLFIFIAILVTVPLSIAGKQLFEKQSGMAWLTAFSSDKAAVSTMTDGIFESIASSSSIDDPMIKQASKLAADKNSPFGTAIRKVFTPESVSENLLTNANSFYGWLEGDSSTLTIHYDIGGTAEDQVGLVSSFTKMRYEQLTACTSGERKQLGKVDSSNVMDVTCSVGSISTPTFDSAAKKFLAKSENKDILAKGLTFDAALTQKNRDEVLAVRKVLSGGVLFSWALLIISALFMILLFTPRGVNFIVTGVIIGMTGLILGAVGQGLSRVAIVLQDTLGRHIALQGLYIAFFGLLVMCVGIWQLIQKKEPQEVENDIAPSPVKAKGKK